MRVVKTWPLFEIENHKLHSNKVQFNNQKYWYYIKNIYYIQKQFLKEDEQQKFNYASLHKKDEQSKHSSAYFPSTEDSQPNRSYLKKKFAKSQFCSPLQEEDTQPKHFLALYCKTTFSHNIALLSVNKKNTSRNITTLIFFTWRNQSVNSQVYFP